MVSTFYPPANYGGDGVFVEQLARDLAGAGHEVHVVHCLDAFRVTGGKVSPDLPVEETTAAGIHVHRLRSRLGTLSAILTQQTGRPGLKARRLAALLDSGFDVINYHNISLVGGPGVLRLGRGVKLYTLHEHWWVCPTHVLFKYTGELCTKPDCLRCVIAQRTPPQAWRQAPGWMARCLESVDLLLAPSRFTAERHRVWMQEHGVDVPLEVLPEYAPPLAGGTGTAMGAAPRPPELPERYFLYAGRVTEAKGALRIADVFARRPEYPLVIAGEGDALERLRARGLANVHLVGRVERKALAAYYTHATALVFPSLCAETFGLAAVEAMSCGAPVVASRSGGPEDIVTPETGFVYAGDEELLAALDRLWADPALGRRLGEAGRERYRREYTPAAYLERYLAAVERARAHHRARRG